MIEETWPGGHDVGKEGGDSIHGIGPYNMAKMSKTNPFPSQDEV